MTQRATEVSGAGASALRRVLPMDQLPEATASALQQMCRIRSFAAGATVVHAGEMQNSLAFVARGILRMQKTLQDGRQHIVGLLFEGDMFGRLFDGPPLFDVETATHSDLCILPRARFEALLLESPELDQVVMRSLLHDLDRARDWLLVVANGKIAARLAGFLVMLCARLPSGCASSASEAGLTELDIPIARVDLANLLGTRVESISRAFHALDAAGLIEIHRPDLVAVRDIEGLHEEAGGDLTSFRIASGERLPPTRTGRV